LWNFLSDWKLLFLGQEKGDPMRGRPL
jgi:hypothetical protein